MADYDYIALSNLNRIAVFGEKNLSKSKSQVLAEKLKKINEEMQIEPFNKFLGADSEKECFDHNFYQNLDFLLCCGDNEQIRIYMSNISEIHDKPIFETGTS